MKSHGRIASTAKHAFGLAATLRVVRHRRAELRRRREPLLEFGLHSLHEVLCKDEGQHGSSPWCSF